MGCVLHFHVMLSSVVGSCATAQGAPIVVADTRRSEQGRRAQKMGRACCDAGTIVPNFPVNHGVGSALCSYPNCRSGQDQHASSTHELMVRCQKVHCNQAGVGGCG